MRKNRYLAQAARAAMAAGAECRVSGWPRPSNRRAVSRSPASLLYSSRRPPSQFHRWQVPLGARLRAPLLQRDACILEAVLPRQPQRLPPCRPPRAERAAPAPSRLVPPAAGDRLRAVPLHRGERRGRAMHARMQAGTRSLSTWAHGTSFGLCRHSRLRAPRTTSTSTRTRGHGTGTPTLQRTNTCTTGPAFTRARSLASSSFIRCGPTWSSTSSSSSSSS